MFEDFEGQARVLRVTKEVRYCWSAKVETGECVEECHA